MGVYLIYREPYNNKNCKLVKQFLGTNLVQWSQYVWDEVSTLTDEDEIQDKLFKYFGIKIYGVIFYDIINLKIERPINIEDASIMLKKICYTNEIRTNNRNFMQILTDDDEIELAFYLFDSEYLIENKKNASYLAIEGFELPETEEPIKSSPHGLNLCFESHWYTSMLSTREPNVYIPEIGIKDLPIYLSNSKVSKDWRIELLILRVLSKNDNGQSKTFDQMMQDFLSYDFTFWNEFMKTYEGQERAFLLQDDIWVIQKELEDKYQSFVPKRPFNKEHGLHRIQRTSNLFQVGIFNEDWGMKPMFGTSPCYLYDHWLFFESSWAEEYPDLASSIDRYFSRWDCLE